ncbi:extracellular serine/threonine protein kinase FAM20C-like isoform X2 [Liolophura sinensis]
MEYPRRNLTSWERFHIGIRKYALYDPEEGTTEDLIRDLVNQEIIDVEEKSGGTQLKLIVTLNNEGMTLFKPQRFGREYETPPNHFYFVDFERHNAEIAAYHLDRVLGFYRVPPTAGRIVNITHDLHRLANHKLAKTFFVSPAKNHCFHGTCSYYCDTTHAVCGSPDMLEGSFASFLPPEKLAPRKTWRNPWKRSYSKHRKATWEVYDDYCDDVRMNPLFKTGRRFLDIMDLTVFDFLIGNMDRHHYETFRDFGNNTFLLHLDHGRSFGKTKHDELSILAPIYQCCLIRRSTFMKLLGFYKGPIHLSDMMRKSMSTDRIAPVLLEPHLEALDRRVSIVLRTISDCLEHGNRIDRVIVDDGF